MKKPLTLAVTCYLLLSIVLAAACNRAPRQPVSVRPPALELAQRAENLWMQGNYDQAAKLYLEIVNRNENGIEPALAGLALLYLQPDNPGRDATAARSYLLRLLSHPASRYRHLAETLVSMLDQIEEANRTLRAQQQTIGLLEAEIERLKNVELPRQAQTLSAMLDELEKARKNLRAQEQTIKQLQAEIERLKKIDLRRR